MATHFLVLERDNIDDTAVCGKEGEELASKLLLIDLVVEVVDVEGRTGLRGGDRGHGGG